MPYTLFDHIENLSKNKIPYDKYTKEDLVDFNPFLINLMLSHNIDIIEFINMFQQYTVGILGKREVYKLYLGLLPKKKIYIKYIKGEQNEQDKEVKQLSIYIKKYFNDEISTNEAMDYISLLTKLDLEIMLNELGIEDKEIKKLLKNI